MTPLLAVEELTKKFPVGRRRLFAGPSKTVTAVDKVGFEVAPQEIFGLVGESGCGKTTTARLILGLTRPDSGRVLFQGRDVTGCSGSARQRLRREMQLVFQDPMASLNPRMSIGISIAESLRFHGIGSPAERHRHAREFLEVVGLSRTYFDGLPHEFSGGQCQRVGIARALILRPKLVILDEPVSALDVSIRAQILNLLLTLRDEFALTYIFISHDLAVIKRLCNRTAVFYMGRVVELGPTDDLYAQPLHPYTRALISAVPEPDPRRRAKELGGIEGDLPSPIDPPQGCRFWSRCAFRMEVCKRQDPELIAVGAGRHVACFLHQPASESSTG